MEISTKKIVVSDENGNLSFALCVFSVALIFVAIASCGKKVSEARYKYQEAIEIEKIKSGAE